MTRGGQPSKFRKPVSNGRGGTINVFTGSSRRRDCLKCGRGFESRGIGNRLCSDCNYANETAHSRVPMSVREPEQERDV